MAHIYISRSEGDKNYSVKLVRYLRDKGLPVWAEDEIEPGENWEKAVESAIENAAVFLIIVSASSSNSASIQDYELPKIIATKKPIIPLYLSREYWQEIGHLAPAALEEHNGILVPDERTLKVLRRHIEASNQAQSVLSTRNGKASGEHRLARLEYLRVQNYRVLRNLTLENMTPLVAFLGPNGSGKSTIFDVFAFLSECFTGGLRKAWEKRNRFKELRSRSAAANELISFELKYRETPNSPLSTYYLAIGEDNKGPYIERERLTVGSITWLDFHVGQGTVFNEGGDTTGEALSTPDLLAVSTLGNLARFPHINSLREFISGWYISYVNSNSARSVPEAGAQEHLSETGDNLANVIQYLTENHSEQLQIILAKLARRVPRLDKIETEITSDGRLLLLVQDIPFEEPIMAKYASDGTLKMLAYLTILHDPDPLPLIGIEEPENQLHPSLLRGLSEECRAATANSQVMITTHSPFFVDGLHPEELWVLYRDEDGYTQAKRAAEMRDIPAFMQAGALLGDLWMEGRFEFGYPLTNAGGLRTRRGQ